MITMKNKLIPIFSILMSLFCVGAIAVSAVTTATQEPQGQTLVSEKVYFAYSNSGSTKGATAFRLGNTFTSYGTSAENIRLCTLNSDGTYTTVTEIPKENTGVWFYGKTELSHETSEDTKNTFGGLSGIGITFDSEKVNVVLKFAGVTLSRANSYYIYIPENYFSDANGIGNVAGYVAIPADKVKSYTGNAAEDFAIATEGLYDAALFGVESVGGLF